MTDEQIAALKYLIFKARDGTDRAKKILSLLIDASEGLEKEVFITVTGGEGFTEEELQDDSLSVGAVQSSNCTTHLGALLHLMGTDFHFTHHYGHMTEDGEYDTTGQFPGAPDHPTHTGEEPVRYTYWLARESYSKEASRVSVSREEIDAVDLSKPGLYPVLEAQR